MWNRRAIARTPYRWERGGARPVSDDRSVCLSKIIGLYATIWMRYRCDKGGRRGDGRGDGLPRGVARVVTIINTKHSSANGLDAIFDFTCAIHCRTLRGKMLGISPEILRRRSGVGCIIRNFGGRSFRRGRLYGRRCVIS